MEKAPSVLVVDDDPFTAELAGAILEEAGYRVTLAEGGVDALAKLAGDASIQVVVSDMNMPFMDGLQLFSELREQGFSQVFVLLTGEATGPISVAHPELDSVVAKDERLPDSLPVVLADLLARS